MALPFSGYYTHAANQVMGGSPFDAVQDLCVAFFAKNRRRPQVLQLPVWAQRLSGWTHSAGDPYLKAGGAAAIHIMPIHLPVGASVQSAYLGYNKAGATAIAFRLRRQSHATGAAANVATVNLTGVAGTWFYDPLNLGTVLEAGYSYWLEAVSGQLNDLAQRCELNYTRP